MVMPRVNGVQFWSPSVTRMKIVFSLGLRWVEMPPPGRAGAVAEAMGVMFWTPLPHRLAKSVRTSLVVWAIGVFAARDRAARGGVGGDGAGAVAPLE